MMPALTASRPAAGIFFGLRGARIIASAPFYVCVLLFGQQFDATVLCASFRIIVGRHEVGLAVAMRMYPALADPILDQVIDHSVGAAIGQPQVVLDASNRVAISIHVDINVGIGLQS